MSVEKQKKIFKKNIYVLVLIMCLYIVFFFLQLLLKMRDLLSRILNKTIVAKHRLNLIRQIALRTDSVQFA